MPEFLQDLVALPQISATEVTARLIASLAGGFLVSWIYRFTRPSHAIAPTFPATLVLLAVLIAMVTQVIGDSIARAFSLVGALSIVRFRTVVRDTQDTAYVIFAVVVGMAVGTSDFIVAAIGMAIVAAAALLTMQRSNIALANGTAPEFHLRLIVALGMDLDGLANATAGLVEIRRLDSFRTVKQGAALEAVYLVRLRPGSSPAEVVRAMNRMEGIQSVEIERQESLEG